MLALMPVFALDLDSTVTDTNRTHYSKGQTTNQTTTNKIFQPVKTNSNTSAVKTTEQITTESAPTTVTPAKLPTVPSLPKSANSSSVAPYNGVYSGRMPNKDALTPCNFVIGDLIIDDSVVKSKYKDTKTIAVNNTKATKQSKPAGRVAILPKGTEFRVINKSQITEYLPEGRTVDLYSTHEFNTTYYRIPKNTKFTARVVDAHSPQLSCNGGLIKLKVESANINGHNCALNAKITKIKTDDVYFSNLKGEHTYWKTVGKKAKWGQKMFSKWSKTSTKLANKGAGVILAPFPYLGGCILVAASTISSPVTAVLGKGGRVIVPANTTFTIKLRDDAWVYRNK